MGAKFAVAQWHSFAGDVEANLKQVAAMVPMAKDLGADVVVIPETFTSGYYDDLKPEHVAQTVPGPATDFLSDLCAKYDVYLFGSMIESQQDKFYNCGVFIDPGQGLKAKYRKMHLFGAEKEMFGAGEEIAIVDTRLGRLGLSICYDLAFPEYIRGLVLNGAEVILNATNWLTVGPPNDWDTWQWSHLQTTAFAVSRALENTVGLVMCCQGAGISQSIYSFGHSCIVSPSGRLLAQLGDGDGVTAAEIPMEKVAEWRSIATYLPDRRVELYKKLLGM